MEKSKYASYPRIMRRPVKKKYRLGFFTVKAIAPPFSD
jgi:hypothetical protein